MRTVEDIVSNPTLPEHITSRSIHPLPTPHYIKSTHPRNRVALAVASMSRHMSDEGWQLMKALRHRRNYMLCGSRIVAPEVACEIDLHALDVNQILLHLDPGVVVVQDKREWDRRVNSLAISAEEFKHADALSKRPDIFKLTVVKDAHNYPPLHAEAASAMGVHAWITYYHDSIVERLAPYVRKQHLIRTYHSVDSDSVPTYVVNGRDGCLLSGYLDERFYPLRTRVSAMNLPKMDTLGHPGYHNRATHTGSYLGKLCHYKVAICTSSVFGYSLRKLIEATACGCTVITDLPVDDPLPEIDGNLVRVPVDISEDELSKLLVKLYNDYDSGKQHHYSNLARSYYDYRAVGQRLVESIEKLRGRYR